jgi:hypothetical protein
MGRFPNGLYARRQMREKRLRDLFWGFIAIALFALISAVSLAHAELLRTILSSYFKSS